MKTAVFWDVAPGSLVENGLFHSLQGIALIIEIVSTSETSECLLDYTVKHLRRLI
jgi:hypothetical protein